MSKAPAWNDVADKNPGFCVGGGWPIRGDLGAVRLVKKRDPGAEAGTPKGASHGWGGGDATEEFLTGLCAYLLTGSAIGVPASAPGSSIRILRPAKSVNRKM